MEAALIGLSVGLLIGLVAGWLWRTESDAKAWGAEMEAMRRLIPEDREPYDQDREGHDFPLVRVKKVARLEGVTLQPGESRTFVIPLSEFKDEPE